MSITLAILDAVLAELKRAHGRELAVEFFPEQPLNYRLNHPVGAILVSYSRSLFGQQASLDTAWLARDLTVPLTLVFRQLNGRKGVIAWLDQVRQTLTGWTPLHCDTPLIPVSEQFLLQNAGIWQYALDFTTQTNQLPMSYSIPTGNEPPAPPLYAMRKSNEKPDPLSLPRSDLWGNAYRRKK